MQIQSSTPRTPTEQPEVQHRGLAGREQRELSPQRGRGRVRVQRSRKRLADTVSPNAKHMNTRDPGIPPWRVPERSEAMSTERRGQERSTSSVHSDPEQETTQMSISSRLNNNCDPVIQ